MILFTLPVQDLDLWDIVKSTIQNKMWIWSTKHNVKYKMKVINDKIILEFSEEKDYTLFMLTWDDEHEWTMVKNI